MKFGEDVPESVMVMILVRLPTRAISRFKCVCSQWKSLLESRYFRYLYQSVNQRNLSSPWSIMYEEPRARGGMMEYFGERWGLRESPGTCLLRFLDDHTTERARAVAIVDGLVLIEEPETKHLPSKFLVGSPVLQQWINIPSPPTPLQNRGPYRAALVTNLNNNGDLLGYKVVKYDVWMLTSGLHFQCYSSETGTWTYHQVFHDCPVFLHSNPIHLNGCLHWSSCIGRFILAYDFYPNTGQESQNSRVIYLPDDELMGSLETCSISCGSLVYIQYSTGQFRVWRLKNHKTDPSKEHWELLWNFRNDGQELVVGGISCFVVTIHPFDCEVVYLEGHGKTHKYLISGNLRTEKFQLLKASKKSGGHTFWKFVLPQRHDSIPLSTWLLSCFQTKSNDQAGPPP